MNRIRLLSEQVANQIAAGEVVERPASVVKELVENALDAEARRITVEVQAGGRSLIRVTDDGAGMNKDDALLCLERHATSKIRKAEDLQAIQTMGFRGEAVPSIASVSRMTLTTQEHGTAEAPTQIVIHGGKILEVRTAGSPPGTCVEVRSLFYNLPARRKFLRSEDTEYGHIHHYLTLAALAHPDVAFVFMRDGRTVWQLPGMTIPEGGRGRLEALRERLKVLSGSNDQWLPVDYVREFQDAEPSPDGTEEESGDESASEPWPSHHRIRVWGLIGSPGVSRSTRQDQHLFVNRRPVENRGLNMALLEGYHTSLMKGRFPVCCLFLELDPARVDVNIHPAKREVKFHHERTVRRVVTQAVRQALLRLQQIAPAKASGETPIRSDQEDEAAPSWPALEPFPLPGFMQNPTAPFPASTRAAQAMRTFAPSAEDVTTEIPVAKIVGRRPQTEPGASDEEPDVASKKTEPRGDVAPAETESRVQSETMDTNLGTSLGTAQPLLRVPLRLVGVVGRLYVVYESDRGMVLMDQHAAHERILFERMLAELERGHAPAQRLLLPETIELSVRDAQFVKEQMETLHRLGVGLNEFGDRTFLLDALPPIVKVSDPRQFVLELIDELKRAGQDVNTMRMGELTIAKTVCRHAVKANDPLSEPELDGLLEDLRRCQMPYTCPHGRPTLIEMSYKELEKKFGRLV